MDDTAELRDRLEIADVLLRYASCIDEKDWDRLAGCFVPDVTAVLAGGPELVGFEAVEEAIRTALSAYDRTHHLIANAEVDLGGDRARLRANLTATHVTGSDKFVVGGVYHEELVRTTEGWRISRHELIAVFFDG